MPSSPPAHIRHVAIIMDGNGRWARSQKKPRLYGHKEGAEAAGRAVRAALDSSVQYLTLFALSKENINRPESEIKGLLSILSDYADRVFQQYAKENVRMRFIGDLSFLQASLHDKLQSLVEKTADNAHNLDEGNKGLVLQIALNYSGQQDILSTFQKMARQCLQGQITPDDITAEIIEEALLTAPAPAPEILIRTGGERRISNFMLWQLAYSELFFLDCPWPDFNEEHFNRVLDDYQNRDRRFGLISSSGDEREESVPDRPDMKVASS